MVGTSREDGRSETSQKKMALNINRKNKNETKACCRGDIKMKLYTTYIQTSGKNLQDIRVLKKRLANDFPIWKVK